MTANAAGEAETGPLRLHFDRTIKLVFKGSSIRSDGGPRLHREPDDAPGPTDMAAAALFDPRRGENGQHQIGGFLRRSVFFCLAGYEDANDAERLRHDPIIRRIVGGKAVKSASASAMGRLETEMLTQAKNLDALAASPGRRIDALHDKQPPKFITLDTDSSESPVHGDQKGVMWNGHVQSKRLHPLFVFNRYGDLERCALRPGGVIHVIRNGLMWKDAPSADGPHKTLCNRFVRWSQAGAFDRIFAEPAAGSTATGTVMIDATHPLPGS